MVTPMLILKNGNVFPVTTLPFRGDVMIKDGKICELGHDLIHPDAQYVDVEGYTVIPGLIDAHCHTGLSESGIGAMGQDENEHSDPILPELRAIDAINPGDDAFCEARQAGVTVCVTGPGSSGLITGQFCAVKTWGSTVEEMILKESLAMKMALGENPKLTYGGLQKKAPETRMSEIAMLRKMLRAAVIYEEKQACKWNPDRWDMKLEALVPVVKGELPVKMHVHRMDDIASAIRIAREFSLRISLEHCTEGYMLIPTLQKVTHELDLRIILGPFMMARRKNETRNLLPKIPAIMHQAGFRFGLMSDHPVTPQRYLNIYAGLAVREGLPEKTALEAVTIDAAHACWIDDRVGSLTVGKDADIAIFEGEPLSIGGQCVMTLINGTIVYCRKEVKDATSRG